MNISVQTDKTGVAIYQRRRGRAPKLLKKEELANLPHKSTVANARHMLAKLFGRRRLNDFKLEFNGDL